MPRRTRRTRRTRRIRRQAPAMRAVRRLARFVDTELHEDEIALVIANITTTGSQVLLTSIGTGDNRQDRTGDQITMRSLKLNFNVTVGAIESIFRVIVFWDRQTNGAVPLLADVLANTAFPTTSVMNVDNIKRFRVISDRCMRMNTLGDHPAVCVRRRYKLRHKIRFDGGGIAVADIVSGALYALYLSDQVGGANSPSLEMFSQVWFAP